MRAEKFFLFIISLWTSCYMAFSLKNTNILALKKITPQNKFVRICNRCCTNTCYIRLPIPHPLESSASASVPLHCARTHAFHHDHRCRFLMHPRLQELSISPDLCLEFSSWWILR